jgi:hypothetical protein
MSLFPSPSPRPRLILGRDVMLRPFAYCSGTRHNVAIPSPSPCPGRLECDTMLLFPPSPCPGRLEHSMISLFSSPSPHPGLGTQHDIAVPFTLASSWNVTRCRCSPLPRPSGMQHNIAVPSPFILGHNSMSLSLHTSF